MFAECVLLLLRDAAIPAVRETGMTWMLFALMAMGAALIFACGVGRIAAQTDRADHAAWARRTSA